MDCGSALAEAEVEYQDKPSTALDARFGVIDGGVHYRRLDSHAGGLVSVPIWTTTPWTLPANQAVGPARTSPTCWWRGA